MKKPLSLLLAVILTLAVLLPLSACGGRLKEDSSEGGEIIAPSPTPERDSVSESAGPSPASAEGGRKDGNAPAESSKEDGDAPAESGKEDGDAPAEPPEENELSAFEKQFADGPLRAQGQNKLWGYIDIAGNWVFEPQFPHAGYFIDGYARAEDQASGLWGIVDAGGGWHIPPKYSKLADFTDGLAAAQDPATGLYGYIDLSGSWVIEPAFYLASSFQEGLAAVNRDDKSAAESDYSFCYSFIDTKGQTVIPPGDFGMGMERNYSVAYLFHDGIAFVDLGGHASLYDGAYSYNKLAIIDKNGSLIARMPDDYLISSEQNSYYSEQKSYNAAADYRRNRLATIGCYIEWNYDWLILGDNDYQLKKERHYAAKGWGSSILINKKGEIVFFGDEYNCAVYLVLNDRGDLFVVDKSTDAEGIINISGEWILKPEPGQSISLIFKDSVSITNDNKRNEKGYLVSSSVEIPGIGGDHPRDEAWWNVYMKQRASGVRAKSATVDGTTKYGLETEDGRLVVDYIFDYYLIGEDGSFFWVKQDGLWGAIDKEGSWLLEPQYLSISHYTPSIGSSSYY